MYGAKSCMNILPFYPWPGNSKMSRIFLLTWPMTSCSIFCIAYVYSIIGGMCSMYCTIISGIILSKPPDGPRVCTLFHCGPIPSIYSCVLKGWCMHDHDLHRYNIAHFGGVICTCMYTFFCLHHKL